MGNIIELLTTAINLITAVLALIAVVKSNKR